ncbi:hypothetical protein FEO90_10410 [Stenotrophomonas maltophilia]|nr:hypothetical protein FEO90_10410 [Stenotrophomonas maltophilia]
MGQSCDPRMDVSMSHQAPWMKNWNEDNGAEVQRGGQGVVRRVHRLHGTEFGALKELRSDAPQSSERRQRMKKEVIGLRRAQGAGIPRVLDSNTEHAADDEDLFIVMEWIDGEALQRHIKKPLAIDEALRITRDLALIVSRCHAIEVLHRDIKPDNIVVDREGVVHLVDFGIAWLPEDERPDGDEETDINQELGNRFLRLPEMAGGHERADRRSDVTFVVGILFYLLTHKKPYKLGYGGGGLPPHDYMRDRFTKATIEDPRFGRILSIFDVGFKTYPNQRFSSAAELIARIEEVIANDCPKSEYEIVFKQFDEMMNGHEEENRHLQLTALHDAAAVFERDIRLLCDQRSFEVAMMAGSPRRQDSSWVTSMRFRHKTHGFGAEGSHVVRACGDTVECISGLRGSTRTYYRGPSADQRRLIEEVQREAKALFAAVLASAMHRKGLIGDVLKY